MNAQTISNLRAFSEGEKVGISYDLTSQKNNQAFFVQVFSSLDDYKTPLNFLTGDAGNEVVSGSNKRISWDYKKEISSLQGEISFAVEATVIAPFTFDIPSKIRRKRPIKFKWYGSKYVENVSLQLVKDKTYYPIGFNTELSAAKKQLKTGSVIPELSTTLPNAGVFSWKIPKYLPKGKYRVVVFSSKTKLEMGVSPPLKIKSSMLGISKLMLTALAGGGAYYAYIKYLELTEPVGPDNILPGPPEPGN